jgi:ketosteroid isomerase-like protein
MEPVRDRAQPSQVRNGIVRRIHFPLAGGPMKTELHVALLTAAVLAFTACQSPSAQFTAADEAEVRALFDSTEKHVSAGAITSWAGQFTDNAIYQPPNAKEVNGRPAILAFGQGFPPVEVSMSEVHVWGEGNLAYGTSAIAFKIKDGPSDTLKQLVVFRRAPAGRWEVAAVSVNSDLPPATAPPVAAPTM